MKKLLSIFGALAVTASTASVTSCEYSKLVKSSIENKVRNYIALSSLLARAAVLSQKSDKAIGGEGLSLKASSQYLYGQSIKNYFSESELPTGGANNTVREMLGSMFNFDASDSDFYTVKSGREGDPFESNLALEDNVDTGRKAQDSIIKILGPLSGTLSLLFGTNFSSKTAPAINDTLGAVLGVVGNAVTENDGALIGKILNFIRLKDGGEEGDVPQGDYIFKNFSESLKEDDLPNIETMTFSDVFAIRYVNAWTGLGQILYSGIDKPNGKTWTEYLENIKKQNEKPNANNANDVADVTIFTKDFKVVFNSRLINGIIDILKFLRTLTVFFNYVDENSRDVTSIGSDDNYSNLFSVDETNGNFLSKALRTNYLNKDQVIKEGEGTNGNITQWVQLNDGNYYQTFNLQSFLGYIQTILSFNPQDPHGYAFARILSLIFSIPTKGKFGKIDSGVMTLPYDGLIGPLAIKFLKLLIPDLPAAGINGIIGRALLTFRGTLGDSTPAWETGPGAVYSVTSLLKLLGGNLLPLPPNIKIIINKLLELIDAEQKASLPLFDSNWGNPIWGIYGNQLIPIILNFLVNNNVVNISKDLINNLENIRKLLTTKMADLLKGFGLDISTLPMFLYGIKGLTITDLINTVANQFDVQRNAKISQQQKYLLNNYSFSQLFGSLNQNIKLTYNGNPPSTVTKYSLDGPDGMNVVMATLIGFGYRPDIKDMTIGEENLSDQKNLVKAPLFALGIRGSLSSDGQPVYTFSKTSVFGSLAAVYGNDTGLPDKIALINRPTMQILIQETGKLVNWFDKVSIPLYVNTFFKPYFAKQNWKTSLIRFNNLEEMFSEAEIVYNLHYLQPDTKKTLLYEVTLKRTAANGGVDGNWDKLGTWYIQKIDRK